MFSLALLIAYIVLPLSVYCAQWPYDRYYGHHAKSGSLFANKSEAEFEQDPNNQFIGWLHGLAKNTSDPGLRQLFINNTVPRKVTGFDELFDYLDIPDPSTVPLRPNDSVLLPPYIPNLSRGQANELFAHLNYPLDARCTADHSKWWYRTYDGSCNWLKSGEVSVGEIGTAKVRDYDQYSYSDGISKPREGPNPRAVSNAFFKRNSTIYYEHTPLLLGMIEFIMHDVTYSQDSSSEFIDVEMPPDEEYFEKNTTFRVWRTEAVPGTGTSEDNKRENVNMASTWLDISSLYGSTKEVADALRSWQGGKLLTQELKTRGQSTYASYLPFNVMNVPMRTRPGVDPKTLFAGGDPRTNEDWLMLGVHTLLLREHNRLCGILAKQHPEYDDEKLYQTIRLVMSAKYALMANSYQMAYWTDKMPWPRNDGFPLYRQMYGESWLEINPANTYPWPLVTKKGKPMVVSAEMAIVYRFHEFIIPEFPIKDAQNTTLWNQNVFQTGFNATGFIDAGLENVLRGTVGTHIPNFKSGVDESFRSAGKYRGNPFDVVTWSIVHEREQGLPTFNQYFRKYNSLDPHVEVPIRNKFEDFSTDPKTVAKLRELYKNPDEVDLVVGVQLDEEMFPGTTVPKSALIISLFSLFGMGNSDRFSIGFAVTRCLLVDKPWDCKPTNALEDLLWAPKSHPEFPNMRWLDPFWLTELDFQAHGTNLLWRLITENSDIKCVQHYPLFPADKITNPILCSLPGEGIWSTIQTLLSTALEMGISLYKQHAALYNTILFSLLFAGAWLIWERWHSSHRPPVLRLFLKWWPILGSALSFQKDPRSLLLEGFKKYGSTVFGLKLASLTHFVITQPSDLDVMLRDNPYEVKFSLHGFLAAINFPLITHKDNFDSDLHTKLIRTHLGDPATVAQFGVAVEHASTAFIAANPLTATKPGSSQHYPGILDYLMKYMTAVVGVCVVGDEVLSGPGEALLPIFAKFNDDAINAMGFSSLLPSFLQFIAGFSINSDYKKTRNILIDIVKQRRIHPQTQRVTFLNFILEAVDDDTRAADLVTIVVWGGLTNLQATFTSMVMDIMNAAPPTRGELTRNLATLQLPDLNTFPSSRTPDPANPWTPLRAAMFESIRLSGPITGPARLCLEPVVLPSSISTTNPDTYLTLPKGAVATLSAYYTHRSPTVYGNNAAAWEPSRFLASDPEIGTPRWVTWGLTGPHTCPGRWFAQECLLVMTKCLLGTYDLVPDTTIPDANKYKYSAGSVTRTDVGVTVNKK